MNESWYVVERDVNQTAANSVPVIYAGPFDSHFEADQNAPEDGDGIEYNVELVSDERAEKDFR